LIWNEIVFVELFHFFNQDIITSEEK